MSNIIGLKGVKMLIIETLRRDYGNYKEFKTVLLTNKNNWDLSQLLPLLTMACEQEDVPTCYYGGTFDLGCVDGNYGYVELVGIRIATDGDATYPSTHDVDDLVASIVGCDVATLGDKSTYEIKLLIQEN